jgi:hypothetical protein
MKVWSGVSCSEEESISMMRHVTAGTSCAMLLLIGGALAQDDLKSGPQVGKNIPGPFHPLNINGGKAGQKNCLV